MGLVGFVVCDGLVPKSAFLQASIDFAVHQIYGLRAERLVKSPKNQLTVHKLALDFSHFPEFAVKTAEGKKFCRNLRLSSSLSVSSWACTRLPLASSSRAASAAASATPTASFPVRPWPWSTRKPTSPVKA